VKLLTLLLVTIVAMIPIIGFIMTISHARKADTIREQRWRKGHGVLYWTLLPGLFGAIILLSVVDVLPRLFSFVGILLLGVTTSISFLMQRKREE
jgi:hypothetical protein